MAIDPVLLEMMNETATVVTGSYADAYGRTTAGASTSVQCYIERSPRLVRNMEGHEVVASATLFCNATAIGPTDIVTVDGKVLNIVSISTFTDEYGALHHQEVYIE